MIKPPLTSSCLWLYIPVAQDSVVACFIFVLKKGGLLSVD